MKKVICLFFLLTAGVSILFAQSEIHSQLRLNSGYAVPDQPTYFSEYWYSGISLGVGYTLPLTGGLSALLHLQFNNFMFDEDLWKEDLVTYQKQFGGFEDSDQPIVTGAMKDLISLSVNLKYTVPLSQKLNSYVIAGGGALYSHTDKLNISGAEIEFENEWTYTGTGGLGLEYQLREDLNVFAGGSYIYGGTRQKNNSEFPFEFSSEYKEEAISFIYFQIGFAYTLGK